MGKPDYEQLWKDFAKMLDEIIAGELPIGDAGEFSQVVSLRAIMENLEEHSVKK